MYISLQFSPIARLLLVKWTLCWVQYISTSEKAILLLQTGTFLFKQTNKKTSGQTDIQYENVRKA